MSDLAYFERFAEALKLRVAPAPDFSDSAPDLANAGLAVYRNNVRSSLSKALAETFPVVEKLVGEAFFKLMAQEYFAAHLPSSPLIVDYGSSLPAFLDRFEPAKSVPYLSAVARLEAAWLSAYHSADAAAAPAAEILTATAGDPSTLKLALHPSVRLRQSAYPAVSIWRYNTAPADHEKPSLGLSESALVFRARDGVKVETISPGVFAAFAAIIAGDDIETATVQALRVEPMLGPQEIFETLFAHQLITGVSAQDRT